MYTIFFIENKRVFNDKIAQMFCFQFICIYAVAASVKSNENFFIFKKSKI